MLLSKKKKLRHQCTNAGSAPSLIELVNNFLSKHKIKNYDENNNLVPESEYANLLANTNLSAPVKQFFFIRHHNLSFYKGPTGDLTELEAMQGNLWRDHVKQILLYDW